MLKSGIKLLLVFSVFWAGYSYYHKWNIVEHPSPKECHALLKYLSVEHFRNLYWHGLPLDLSDSSAFGAAVGDDYNKGGEFSEHAHHFITFDGFEICCEYHQLCLAKSELVSAYAESKLRASPISIQEAVYYINDSVSYRRIVHARFRWMPEDKYLYRYHSYSEIPIISELESLVATSSKDI